MTETRHGQENVEYVETTVVTPAPMRPDEFTANDLEGALDKASRPVKGKYADVPYSSEDLIRDKRAEVELEER